MTLAQIIGFIILGGLSAGLVPRWRGWLLLIVSIIAIYWLQPPLNIRWLDYSLPTATLLLTAGCWYITLRPPPSLSRTQGRSLPDYFVDSHTIEDTTPPTPTPSPLTGVGSTRDNTLTIAFIILIPLLLTIPRYIALPIEITSRPPETVSVLLALVFAVFAIALTRILPYRLTLALIVLIGLLIALKTAPLSIFISGILRNFAGQDITLASPLDLEWLGFSYVAFRLIHTLRDAQTGILPPLKLREYVTYVIFFPAYTAGPLDRVERFITDLRAAVALDTDQLTRAGVRISSGLFKKFIIADSLAVFSLSPTLAQQADSSAAMWLMLYAYAFRLYFDFSGYTDIATGIGMLFGIQLPENFDRPYLQRNITLFWQSWHKTLSDFVRFYVYSPLTRALLRRKLPTYAILLIGNLATMGIIGLWHGVTLPFAVWGLWHALGLFAHKLWTDRTRGWYRGLAPASRRLWHLTGVMLTFHFVLLGWVWFALPDMTAALHTFSLLFGIK